MIAIVNGPNLNRLGKRDAEIYGTFTLSDLEEELKIGFGSENLIFFQSNSEGALIDFIQECDEREDIDGIVINPGAYSHYSYALADALADCSKPVIEVHLSNILSREDFRRVSVTAAGCCGAIAGLGRRGYHLAVDYLLDKIKNR